MHSRVHTDRQLSIFGLHCHESDQTVDMMQLIYVPPWGIFTVSVDGNRTHHSSLRIDANGHAANRSHCETPRL